MVMKWKYIVFLGFVSILFFAATPVHAAAPAHDVETLDASKVAFDDFSITVHVENQEANSYKITSSPDEGTTNTTEVEWTGEAGGENTFYFSVSTPADKTLEIYLSDLTDHTESLDIVYYPDDDDIVNQDSITNYIILVALIVIPVLLVKGIMRGFR